MVRAQPLGLVLTDVYASRVRVLYRDFWGSALGLQWASRLFGAAAGSELCAPLSAGRVRGGHPGRVLAGGVKHP